MANYGYILLSELKEARGGPGYPPVILINIYFYVLISDLKDAREGFPGSRALDTFKATEFTSIFQKIKLSFILLVSILDPECIFQKIKLSFILLVSILGPECSFQNIKLFFILMVSIFGPYPASS